MPMATRLAAMDPRWSAGVREMLEAVDRVLMQARKAAFDAQRTTETAEAVLRAAATIDEVVERVNAGPIAHAAAVFEARQAYYRGETARRIAEAGVESYRRQQERLHRLLASLNLDEAEFERHQDALRAQGWFYPPNLPSDGYFTAGRLATRSTRTALRQHMVGLSRSPAMSEAAEAWLLLPGFQRRKSIIRDGMRDHRAGRYRVSIPTLLPQLEGILMEVFQPPTPTSVSVPQLAATVPASYDEAPDLVTLVAALWAWQDFGTLSPTDRRLNRHAVLHGRTVRYGTGENSARVLFALDLVAGVVRDHTGVP